MTISALRSGEVQDVVAAVLDAAAAELEADDGQQQLAQAGCRGQAKRHAQELVGGALEGEPQVLAELGLDVEGQEAVCEVRLAEPAARGTVLERVVDALVLDLVLGQVIVEVPTQVEDQARLARLLDDHVERLDAVEVFLAADGLEGAEVAVVVEALLDEDAVTCDGGRVAVPHWRGLRLQLRVDAAAQELDGLVELCCPLGVRCLERLDDLEPEGQALLDLCFGQRLSDLNRLSQTEL